jgi:plastocyanin
MRRRCQRPMGCLGQVLLCLALLGVGPPVSAQVTVTGQVVSPNGTSRKALSDASQVVVWLTALTGRSAKEASLPHQQLRLVQRHKSFEPHLLVIQAGSLVQFPNDDPFFHNVFSLFEGKRFDLGLYEAGSTRSVLFDKPGICYLFCNIHPEMSAVVIVLTTPYYAISDRAGQISISDVPPGRYELEIWNERSLAEDLKSLTRQIDISDSAHSLGTIRVKTNPNQMMAHKNKYGRDYDNPTPPNSVYAQP